MFSTAWTDCPFLMELLLVILAVACWSTGFALTEDQQLMLQAQNSPSSHWAMDFLALDWKHRHEKENSAPSSQSTSQSQSGQSDTDRSAGTDQSTSIYPALSRSLPSGHPFFLTRNDLEKYFEPTEVSALLSMVQSFAAYPEESVWSPVESVSISNPFIFFHQRKAGGSSLRSSLFHAATKLELPYYIPCFSKVDCDTYHFDHKKPYAVYGGHFHWGEQSVLNRFSQNSMAINREHFSCVTNYRHPIDRIESCLYFRFNRILEGRCLGQITLDELHTLLHHVDSYGATCLSEPFRVMGGVSDEAMLDHLASVQRELQLEGEKRRSLRGADVTATRETQQQRQRRLDMTAIDILLVNTTLQNSLHCSPLVLELPQSFDEVAKRIPSLGHLRAFSADRKENVNNIHQHCSSNSMTEAQRRMIREHALLELVVYEAIYKKTYQRLLRSPNFWLTQTCWYSANQYWYKHIYSSSQNNTQVSSGNNNKSKSPSRPVLFVVRYDDAGLALRSMLESAIGYFINSFHKGNFQKNDYCMPSSEESSIVTMDPIRFGFQVDLSRNHQPRFATHINLDTSANCLFANMRAEQTANHRPDQEMTVQDIERVTIMVRDPFVAMWKHIFQKVDQATNLNEKEFADKLLTMLEERRREVIEQQQQGTSSSGTEQQHPRRSLLASLMSLVDNFKLPNGGILTRRHHGGGGNNNRPHVPADININPLDSSTSGSSTTALPPPQTQQTQTQTIVHHHVHQITPKLPQQPKNQPPRVVHFNRKPPGSADHNGGGSAISSQLLSSLRSNANNLNHTKTITVSSTNPVIQKMSSAKKPTSNVPTAQRFFGKKKLHYVAPAAIPGLDVFYKATLAEMMFDFDTFRAMYNEGVELPNLEQLLSKDISNDPSGKNKKSTFDLNNMVRIQYPKEKYHFYSHESVSVSAFQMLEELLLPSSSSQTPKADMNANSVLMENTFVKLVKELIPNEELDLTRVSCAFSFVATMDRELIVQDLPRIKTFYSAHPLVLEAVRKVVKESLNLLRLQTEQMNFLFPL